MLVHCAHYKDGCRANEGPLPLDDATARHKDGDGFVWIGLADPGPDKLLDVAERFDLPPLAVEDAMTMHQRPKIEDYEDGYFLVLHSARYIDETEVAEFGEVHVFTGPGYVIVVRQGATNDLRDARERLPRQPDRRRPDARERRERKPELLRLGPAAAVWAGMDKVVDDYGPVVEGLENDIEEVE